MRGLLYLLAGIGAAFIVMLALDFAEGVMRAMEPAPVVAPVGLRT